MANSPTTLKKGDNLPPRGRSNKTIILEMMREKGHLSLSKEATKEESEKAFFDNVATSAFNPEDQNRGMCLKLLADKGWASVKPSSEMINFEFNEDAKPHVQAAQVMKGAADGVIPPDIANTFINSIKAMIDIEEHTDLKERIEAIEKSLGLINE
tara:strand:- start:1604 stop:2068 length:465 start_codon:yes stop_codon:yes gene_type:complete